MRSRKAFKLTSSGIVDCLETLPFLLGLAGSEGTSLTSEDTLGRRSLLRCGNRTLRRDFVMITNDLEDPKDRRKRREKGKRGGIKGGRRGEKSLREEAEVERRRTEGAHLM